MFIEGQFNANWMIWAYAIERKSVLLDTQWALHVQDAYVVSSLKKKSTNRGFYTSDPSITYVKFKRAQKYSMKSFESKNERMCIF